MPLEVKDINTIEDMQNFVEGCINDLSEGLSTGEETKGHLRDYTLRVIELTEKQIPKPKIIPFCGNCKHEDVSSFVVPCYGC